MVERHRIDRGVDLAGGEQRRQRGGEAQPARQLAVVERLDAEAVAAEQHAAAVALPQGEGEHAVEAADEVGAPGMVGLEQHLGVAVGVEAVALGLELAAQLGVVVHRAVEHDAEAELGIEHRLLGGVREVHDLQPAVAVGLAALGEGAAGVRPARHLAGVHAPERRQVGLASVESELTGDSAHEDLLSHPGSAF